MFRVCCGDYVLSLQADGLPAIVQEYRRHAALAEHHESDDDAGAALAFCAVGGADGAWPALVVTQRYAPDTSAGFHPGALLIPETGLLLLGAGRRLLAYDLATPARLWQDEAASGFWAWGRHGDVALMAAELELAAWDARGRKLWTRFVEPPWEYRAEGGVLVVDVMGSITRLDPRTGQEIAPSTTRP